MLGIENRNRIRSLGLDVFGFNLGAWFPSITSLNFLDFGGTGGH